MTEAQGDTIIALLTELTNQGDVVITGTLWAGAALWSLFGFIMYWFFLEILRKRWGV